MKSRRPSPALVISIIALVVALGGTATAAVVISSSSQIKNGVITGADIRNSSITGSDVRKGTLTGSKLRNDTITLSKLSPGTERLIRRGGGGTIGSSDDQQGSSFEGFRKAGPENQPPGGLVRVASVRVPAGAYAITAKTIMTPILDDRNLFEGLLGDESGIGGECTLDAAGDADIGRATIVAGGRPTPATITAQITRTFGEASTIALNCGSNVKWRTSDTTIIALNVPTANRVESTE